MLGLGRPRPHEVRTAALPVAAGGELPAGDRAYAAAAVSLLLSLLANPQVFLWRWSEQLAVTLFAVLALGVLLGR